MGDMFESMAGAVYLDSGCDVEAVWRVFHALIRETIDECCERPPQNPIRELLEMQPDRVKFS